ncbi:Erlin-2 [Orobanche minor]
MSRGRAEKIGLESMDVKALQKLNKNKKLVKKLAKKCHAFLASEVVIKQNPRLLGPGLNKAVSYSCDPPRIYGVQGECDQNYGQVPVEEGPLHGSSCWEFGHGRANVSEYPNECQLFGFSSSEELSQL